MKKIPFKPIAALCIAASSAAAAVWSAPLQALAGQPSGGEIGRYYIDAQGLFLTDINCRTSIADFKAGFPGIQAQVFSGDAELTEGYVATGHTVRLTRSGQTEEYAAVVHGDLNGDGAITISDVMELCKLLAQNTAGQHPVYDATFCAAGVDGYLAGGETAQSVSISDVMTLCKSIASGHSIRYAPRIKGDGLALSSLSMELAVGQTEQLTASLTDPMARPLVTWSTDRPDILSVSSRGGVTALAAGRAVVTASCRGVTAACAVEVTGAPAEIIAGSYALQSVSTQQLIQMDENGGLSLAAAETPGDAQALRIEPAETGYILRPAADEGYTLEARDGTGAPSAELGSSLAFRHTDGQTAFVWAFSRNQTGDLMLHPAGNRKAAAALSDEGTVALQPTDSGDSRQGWRLIQTEQAPQPTPPAPEPVPDPAPKPDPEPQPPAAERAAWIYNLQTSPSVHVRTGPSTGYESIGGFLKGQEITVTGDAVDGWYPVRGNNLGTGALISGYTSGAYITFTKPTTNPEPMPADIEAKLTALRAKFPNGKYWNHIGGPNNPDGWTDTPCPSNQNGGGAHTHNTYLPGECDCNNFNNAIQCMGFAFKIGNELFGSNVRYWTKFYHFDQVKIGDYIRYGGHSVIVIGKDDTGVKVVECNFDHQCGIRWDRFIPRATLESQNAEYRTHN
ncbi:MAG: SH3 domain-containing protein [Clostridiales bacterium]|nr:SH3 domain-containing protein [Clostridiales bacterium]